MSGPELSMLIMLSWGMTVPLSTSINTHSQLFLFACFFLSRFTAFALRVFTELPSGPRCPPHNIAKPDLDTDLIKFFFFFLFHLNFSFSSLFTLVFSLLSFSLNDTRRSGNQLKSFFFPSFFFDTQNSQY